MLFNINIQPNLTFLNILNGFYIKMFLREHWFLHIEKNNICKTESVKFKFHSFSCDNGLKKDINFSLCTNNGVHYSGAQYSQEANKRD
jgi:hypothetical protein